MLVDAEWLFRRNRSLERKLREAKLRLGQACIEDIDYKGTRKLDKVVIRQLATCSWVADNDNVIHVRVTVRHSFGEYSLHSDVVALQTR